MSYKIDLVNPLVFNSKTEIDKVCIILANNNIKFDIVEVTEYQNPDMIDDKGYFEKPDTREKFNEFKKRKKIT